MSRVDSWHPPAVAAGHTTITRQEMAHLYHIIKTFLDERAVAYPRSGDIRERLEPSEVELSTREVTAAISRGLVGVADCPLDIEQWAGQCVSGGVRWRVARARGANDD